MLVFISPSKTFTNDVIPGNEAIFKEETTKLFNEIKSFGKDELKEKFNLSDKLVDEVYHYYHEPQEPSKAIYRYGGILYKALDAKTLKFMDNKIFIFSAMYGLLNHDDQILKYRIDFTHRMLGNLYHYWKNKIESYLIKHYQNEILVDLTSKEFEVLIPNPKIRIDFKLIDKNTSTVLLKQMRGKFARYIINNNLKTIDEIKNIIIDDFKFDCELSTDSIFYFTK